MHIVVLLAGIADSKRPLPRPASGDWRDIAQAPDLVYQLSPFDEAALETALKIRTGREDVALTVLVTHAGGDASLMRTVAAFRPDTLAGLDIDAVDRWSPAVLADHVQAAFADLDKPVDLVLIGREHGDTDDGVVPAYLAQALGLPFVGLALDAKDRQGTVVFQRSGREMDESIAVPEPVMASITNHKGNRLRHPLLKNVLHAKQQKFVARSRPGAAAPQCRLIRAQPAEQSSRDAAPCRMLSGDLADQAGQLASHLKDEPTSDVSHAD